MMKLMMVTPTRNAAEFLEECIESVQRQRAPGVTVEHLIVDSGSVDGTLEIAERRGVQILHVDPVCVFHSINEGNAAAVAADADVIGFLGGDDTLLPGAAEILAEWHSRRRSSWLVGRVRWVDATGRSLGDFRPPPRWMTQEMYGSLGWSCIPLQSTFLTPELLKNVGKYDTSFEYSGDYEYLARALEIEGFDRSSYTLSTNRFHGAQLSMSPDSSRWQEVDRIVAEFAPESNLLKMFYRYLLKVVLNGASPRWSLMKHMPKQRAILRHSK